MPVGLSLEQKRFFILLCAKETGEMYEELSLLSEEGVKNKLKAIMFEKKEWDDSILTIGGISYFKLSNSNKLCTSDGNLFKPKYRVAMTSDECDKKLKFRIKTASGSIFSVASKTGGEAQAVVDSIFGRGMYRVSQMLC